MPSKHETRFPGPHTVIACLVVAMSASSAAQAAVLEDPAGDVQIAAASDVPGIPSDGWEQVDLVAAEIEEGPSTIRFLLKTVQVREEMDFANGVFQVRFAAMERRHLLHMYQEEENGAVFAELSSADQNGTLRYVGQLIAYLLPPDAIVAEVPRDYLRSVDGQLPLAGTALTNITVRAQSFQRMIRSGTGVAPYGPVLDLMPDEGGIPGTFPFSFGHRFETGALGIQAAPYYRTSNGEITNGTYSIRLANRGGVAAAYHLVAENVPNGWNVSIQPPTLEVGARREATAQVNILTTGMHGHGGFADLLLKAIGTDDGKTAASVRIGFIYHSIPQPTGHHPVLYLHSRAGHGLDSPGRVTMNSLEIDPADAGLPSDGWNGRATGNTRTYRWTVCLLPSIGQPLQFKDGAGSLESTFTSELPLTNAVLSGDLVLANTTRDPECGNTILQEDEVSHVLGTLVPNEPVALDSEGTTVKLNFQPVAPGTTVFPAANENLALRLTLQADGPLNGDIVSLGKPGAAIAPGGILVLPLQDLSQEILATFDARFGAPATPPLQLEQPAEEAPNLGFALVLAALLCTALLRRGRA